MVASELVAAIEEAFGIGVTDDELRVELFESLRGLVGYVEGKTLSASCWIIFLYLVTRGCVAYFESALRWNMPCLAETTTV